MRTARALLAALLVFAAGGCLDPIVGARCADGFVPCQGRCVAVCTIDGGSGEAGTGDGGASLDGTQPGDGGQVADGGLADGGTGDGGTGDGGTVLDGAGDGPRGDGRLDAAGTLDAGASGDGGAQAGDAPAGADAALVGDASDGTDAGADDDAAAADGSTSDGATADVANADTSPAADTAAPDAAVPPDAPPPINCGMLTLCPGNVCIDTTSDPDNCGVCGRSCGTGLCVAGVCQQRQAGHLVVIGHDYSVSRTGMDNIIGNAVFLAPGTMANVAAYQAAATDESIRGADAAINRVAATTGRTWRKTVVAAADVQSSLAFADVFLIYAQAGATDATLLMLGNDWATTLSDFVQAGKTIVLLEGVYPNAGTFQIVQQANLFHATGRTDVTGQTVTVTRPGDAVATRVPQTYRGERGTVWFNSVDQTVVVQVVSEAGIMPVVIHLVF